MRFIIALLLTLVALSSHAHYYKKTTSDICHSNASPYFDRITNFEKYYEITDCIADGGRPSRWDEEEIATNVPEYDRNRHFGYGWADTDRDCQNTRQEILIEQSTGPVYFADDDQCRVVRGRWISVFTNEVITDASTVDIDHVVPLKWAWDHGAYLWTREKRIQFANDPVNLISVEASLNRAKGAKGPDVWLPPKNRCGYIARFQRILVMYDLQLTDQERQTVQAYINEFC